MTDIEVINQLQERLDLILVFLLIGLGFYRRKIRFGFDYDECKGELGTCEKELTRRVNLNEDKLSRLESRAEGPPATVGREGHRV